MDQSVRCLLIILLSPKLKNEQMINWIDDKGNKIMIDNLMNVIIDSC